MPFPVAIWTQNYDPLSNAWLSTTAAAIPVVLLFYLLAVKKIHAHMAAIYAFVVSILLAAFLFRMPAAMVAGAVAHGLVYAVVRIAWTLLCAVFVYEVTVETGHFAIIKDSIGGVTADRRLQVLLIAFAFGAVLEGAGGGGAPVAIAGAMMVGLGFQPFAAAVLCLIANTAPVAFGGVGNPVRVLVAVTGLGDAELSAMIGRILPWTALILPFWLIRSMTTWANTFAVWPGLLVCGAVFAAIQFYWSGAGSGPPGRARSSSGQRGGVSGCQVRSGLAFRRRYRHVHRRPALRTDARPELRPYHGHLLSHLLPHALQHGCDHGHARSG